MNRIAIIAIVFRTTRERFMIDRREGLSEVDKWVDSFVALYTAPTAMARLSSVFGIDWRYGLCLLIPA